ncbi:MAG TPA: hypothetical protein VE871_06955 [Longimicrobium sp.]|nr:hypothetical protein [Longimicrobium sp.]
MRKITRMALSAAAALFASVFGADRAEAQIATNDCYYCISCTLNGQPGHRVLNVRVPANGTTVGLTIPEPNECGPGPCSNPQDPDVNHQRCVRPRQTAFNLTSLTEAVKSGDMAQVAVLMEQGGEIVEVNTARSALQVVGCDGAIVAHLPLNQVQLTQLSAPSARMAAAE